jgi:uncharacterized protein (DUF1684 family)
VNPTIALTLILLAAPGAAGETLEAETQAFHEKRIAALTRDDGWLTLVGLSWLAEGPNTAGASPDSVVSFPSGAPPRVGVFTRHGTSVSFEANPAVAVQSRTGRVTQSLIPVGPDDDSEPMTVGRFRFYVIRRGDRVGVRIKDPSAAARRDFKGIPLFPPSAEWRIEARFEPAPPGSTLAVQNVLGQIETSPTPGTAVFRIAGKEYRLAPTLEGDELFFVFGDETNRDLTYGSGRFLTTPAAKDGKVILDFNQAINPPCAFTPYATCPIPPKGNRLPLRVEAGEKRVGNH